MRYAIQQRRGPRQKVSALMLAIDDIDPVDEFLSSKGRGG